MSGVLAAKPTNKEQEKGRVDVSRVRRYWPGKAPTWTEPETHEPAPRDGTVTRTAVAAPVIVRKQDDPRLARLAQRRDNREEALEERRRIRAAEVVRRRRSPEAGGEQDDEATSSSSSSESEEEAEAQLVQEESEDEEEVQRRREAIRERLRQQQLAAAAQEGGPGGGAEAQEEEEEESSEYTTDDDDEPDGLAARRLIKPVFVPKAARETLAEREALEKEEEAAMAAAAERAVQRKQETRQLLVEVIAAEEAAERAAKTSAGPAGLEEVETDDEADFDAAYEAWKLRELARIRRDRQEREAADKEVAERERLKNMTEAERAEWERLNPKTTTDDGSKAKWKFLQKYWHKGAFFQDNPDDVRATAGSADIFKRDFSAPTGEDRVDKELLPAVMQVKNFGRSGRTKWTHLLNEDTSVKARADDWYRGGPRPEERRGAVSGGFARFGGVPPGGVSKRAGGGDDEFSKPKKFKT